jgi:cell division protein FtsB
MIVDKMTSDITTCDSRRRSAIEPAAGRPAGRHEPLRRRRDAATPPKAGGFGRRTINSLLLFITVVLVGDALVGDKGVIETIHARRQYREVVASLDGLRRENARLREEVRRLKEDPAAIEDLARKELGLIRPGEVLFIVKDSAPAH